MFLITEFHSVFRHLLSANSQYDVKAMKHNLLAYKVDKDSTNFDLDFIRIEQWDACAGAKHQTRLEKSQFRVRMTLNYIRLEVKSVYFHLPPQTDVAFG